MEAGATGTKSPDSAGLPFELQHSERVLRLCRRHWLYFWPSMGGHAAATLLAPIIAAGLVGPAGVGGLASRIIIVVALLWVGYWGIRTYLVWYRYRHDLWVVTNQRVVDSIRRHWFHHRMASADVIDIEDMLVFKEGLLPTLFNFGDVRCQTAGEVPNFILAGIPHPAEVLGLVDAARDAARRELARPGDL